MQTSNSLDKILISRGNFYTFSKFGIMAGLGFGSNLDFLGFFLWINPRNPIQIQDFLKSRIKNSNPLFQNEQRARGDLYLGPLCKHNFSQKCWELLIITRYNVSGKRSRKEEESKQNIKFFHILNLNKRAFYRIFLCGNQLEFKFFRIV